MSNPHEAAPIKRIEMNTQMRGKGSGGAQTRTSKVRVGSGRPNGKMPKLSRKGR